MPAPLLPDVVAHADWSVDGAKRWIAVARRRGASFELEAPERVGPVADRLGALAGSGRRVLLGLDAPVGLPAAYAAAAGVDDFPAWLRTTEDLDAFAQPAAVPGDISLARPFYPLRPGGARQHHLVTALGARRLDDLRRVCERCPPLPRPACPLFWTLGPNQVGKAALAAWFELRRAPVRLWPFETGLVADGLVVAEAYPAVSVTFVGAAPPGRWSKRRQADRAVAGAGLLAAAGRLGATADRGLRSALLAGFGPAAAGEDPFDAVAGLLGLLHVLRGGRPSGPPASVPEALTVEGWVVGV